METEDLGHWKGRLDFFVDTVQKQVDTLFKSVELCNNRTQLLDDELAKNCRDNKEELRRDIVDIATKLSNLTSKLTVIVAIGSFVGTVVTSLFVAAIIKIFLK